MTDQTTNRPWIAFVQSGSPDGWQRWAVGDGKDVLIAKDLAEDSARLIVKAVNCHDELVEALKKSQLALNSVLKFSHGDDLVDLHDEAYYANIKINEVLSKTEQQ